MKKNILILILTFSSLIGFSQNENVLYIVDSIPVIQEPRNGFGTLAENEIDNVVIVKDKKVMELSGYKDLDGIIYVFTKAYIQRPDSIKAIPTTKLMTKKKGTWYIGENTTPYTGPFIDYYLNGKKEGEGVLHMGRLRGKRLLYHLNGEVSDEYYYENGLANGSWKQFYENGELKEMGYFNRDKKIGKWEMFYPNQQLKQILNYNENGKLEGDAITFYSTGKINGKGSYRNGTYNGDKINDKIFKLYNQAQIEFKQGKFKSAIKKYSKCLELNSNWADGYFARGTAYLENLDFDNAINDFDKTLEIEPYYAFAYANRAFVIITKYEFGNSRTISKSKDVHIIISNESEIPELELNKICADLSMAISLGDSNRKVLDAQEKYCKE